MHLPVLFRMNGKGLVTHSLLPCDDVVNLKLIIADESGTGTVDSTHTVLMSTQHTMITTCQYLVSFVYVYISC